MKVRSKDLESLERIEILDALYTAAGAIKGRAAMKQFLRDLLTESERIMLGRRILVARHLIAGKTYEEIGEGMRMAPGTISRIDRWLHDQFPGYETALKGLEDEFNKRKKKRDEKYLYATSALYRLKKKYPIHFLLFPWPKA
ncbi:MAG: Trp family transcriptional regulator [Patescibacteria group bacterium]